MKQLKERIKKSGLKQTFIADKIGIGTTHLTMMLNGYATMSVDLEVKINEFLDKYLVKV